MIDSIPRMDAFVDSALNQADLESMLESSGGLLHGHFKLASGRHSDLYIEKFRLLESPKVLGALCKLIANHFADKQIDLVVGPSTGGILVAYEVARQIGLTAVYVEAENKTRVLRRGAVIPAGSRVLLVDDVLTTGLSLQEVIGVLNDSQASLVAVSVLIDRSETPIEFGAPFFAACRFPAQSFSADEIPDWLNEIPVTVPGTRQQETR